MATTRRRPVLGGVSGLLFGLFLGLDLWLFGIVDSDSVVITILPAVFLVVGLVLGLVRPIRLGRRRVAESRPAPEPEPAREPAAPATAAGGGASGWRPIDEAGDRGPDDGGDGGEGGGSGSGDGGDGGDGA